MPAYVIACVKDVWNQDKLIEYRERNTDAVANHGGRFVARGGRQEILEGEYEPIRVGCHNQLCSRRRFSHDIGQQAE
jgi:uncharacterized protein (DUF1330 family)